MITREELEKWAKTVHLIEDADSLTGYINSIEYKKPSELLDLLWPFVEALQKIQADPKRGIYADEQRLFYELKAKLGMPLMEWEK